MEERKGELKEETQIILNHNECVYGRNNSLQLRVFCKGCIYTLKESNTELDTSFCLRVGRDEDAERNDKKSLF